MKKIWLAYKFRGRNVEEVKKQLHRMRQLLRDQGYEVVIMAEDVQNWNFDPQVMSKAEAVRRAMILMRGCDLLLGLHDTDAASEGRGWETGFFAGLGKPTVLAVHKSVDNAFIEALFTENPATVRLGFTPVIRYDQVEEVIGQLRLGSP